ncbi:hypothetical protein K488DRAFT_48758 [Vararia minispora EC-137]|uniref:Uncharacterized protein n=1 Tax=Vararia minispora EC-137 TaxID=1314806 RepID=A0ACB8QND2_9AGAM|nr:hypothetical protein K488DRAFT_48758 [Vararia minispora EC-137]
MGISTPLPESPDRQPSGEAPRRPTVLTPPPHPEYLHTFSCPVCFSAPSNATLTPCGHIMCGECLFSAVSAAVARTGVSVLISDLRFHRCPVCRAVIPGWDGRGGGVIGLKPKVLTELG